MNAVVFDLDGTLLHSAPDLHAAAEDMLEGLGRRRLDLAAVTSFIGNGVPTLVRRCLDATGGADDAVHAAALARFLAAYNAAPTTLTRPYDGVTKALAVLQGAGLALGVCTNKPEGVAREILAELGLARFFGAVTGGDTLPVMKPDPAPLHHCLAALGADASAALYVGDSETDDTTAHAAAIGFALYTGGYRKTPVEAFRTVFVFDDFRDLPGLIV